MKKKIISILMIQLVEPNRILFFGFRTFKSLKIELVCDMYGLLANVLAAFFVVLLTVLGKSLDI